LQDLLKEVELLKGRNAQMDLLHALRAQTGKDAESKQNGPLDQGEQICLAFVYLVR